VRWLTLYELSKTRVTRRSVRELAPGKVALPDWNRHDFIIDNKASAAKKKPRVIESVCCNF
jgi:hypothetical protein